MHRKIHFKSTFQIFEATSANIKVAILKEMPCTFFRLKISAKYSIANGRIKS